MPSTLNAEYQLLPETPVPGGEIWSYAREALAGNNVLVNSLRSVGYEYWHSSSVIWSASV